MLVVLGAISVTAWGAGPVESAGAAPATEALDRLKAGNARFAADAVAGHSIGQTRRVELAQSQTPYAIVLSCADSRVPPEIVFDTGLGDLFVVRAAGAVADRAILASVEYGAEHLHSPLLVVMGHDSCGAVTAAIETKTSLGPNLDYLVKAIQPALEQARHAGEKAELKTAIMANVEQVINDVLAESAIVRHLAESGRLQIVGAYYELESGRVHFSKPVGVARQTTHDKTEGQ
ncbi:MAG: carbonic anhydrase [Vicinamibacterales bacterium]